MILDFSIYGESSMASGAAKPIFRTRTRPPRLTLLPAVTAPLKSLFFSALLHGALVASLIWLPILFPIRTVIIVRAADLLHEYDYQPLVLPVLPELKDSGPRAEIRDNSASAALTVRETRPTRQRASAPRKPDYASPQEIVADLSDPTNNVEVIRRPDLFVPPDLVYPVRLPSVVMVPPRARAPVTTKLDSPVWTQSAQIDFAPTASSTGIPAVPVSAPQLPVAALAPMAPRPSSNRTEGALDSPGAPDITESKAAVVINAVSIPAEPLPPIPDAQLSGKFVVGPSKDTNGPEVAAVPSVIENSLRVIADANAPAADPASSSNGGVAPLSGHTALAEKGVSRGISISGGVPARITTPMTSTRRKPYAITVVSGGGSGGAARDFGVFDRDETVYTVYIPMAEVADGSAWPFEYALISTLPPGNALLTPPVVLKKVPATGPEDDNGKSGRVFVAGIITETGKLEGLRAIHASGARAESAVTALAQWEFEPAQLEGKAVASKMLIGITIVPEGKAVDHN
jgi:hypothetical protein